MINIIPPYRPIYQNHLYLTETPDTSTGRRRFHRPRCQGLDRLDRPTTPNHLAGGGQRDRSEAKRFQRCRFWGFGVDRRTGFVVFFFELFAG